MKTINNPLFRVICLVVLLLTMLACSTGENTPATQENLPATQEALMQTQVALSVQQTVQAQNAAAPATAMPPAAPATQPVPADPCAGKPAVSFSGTSFCYTPGLTANVASEMMLETVSEMSEAFNEPQHPEFTFQGYVLSPTFHTPTIRIYPIEAFKQINPSVTESIAELQTAIQTQASNLEHMPFLPNWNAAQMTSMQVKYLTFQNGQGVRYLTQYGQSFWPINNEDMFYTFQGLTNDGQYYISAILPVSNPILPANGDAYTGDINALGDIYQSYLADIKSQINTQPPNSFNPQLNQLDEMIQSLLVAQ